MSRRATGAGHFPLLYIVFINPSIHQHVCFMSSPKPLPAADFFPCIFRNSPHHQEPQRATSNRIIDERACEIVVDVEGGRSREEARDKLDQAVRIPWRFPCALHARRARKEQAGVPLRTRSPAGHPAAQEEHRFLVSFILWPAALSRSLPFPPAAMAVRELTVFAPLLFARPQEAEEEKGGGHPRP